VKDDEITQPGLACWYCSGPIQRGEVVRMGILRSRTEKQGGPYRLFVCPECKHSNICEKTPKGRWFSSPNFRPNLLEYALGRLFLAQPEDFLHAMAWYRENEERRRYFFERDGDGRYSTGGLLTRLWPHGRGEREADAYRSGGRQEKERENWYAPPRDEPPRGEPKTPRPQRPVANPWDILGLEDGASDAEIRRAFHRLAVQYHPDKVHHLGEEFQTVATTKFKELQRAYEALIKRQYRD